MLLTDRDGKEVAATIIDQSALPRIIGFTWSLVSSGRYAGRAETKAERTHHNRGVVYLHRFIAQAVEGEEVDHVNGNKLDNRLSNLRIGNPMVRAAETERLALKVANSEPEPEPPELEDEEAQLPARARSTPRKPLVGHHLMRVRVQKYIFDMLQEAAEEETVRAGEHVTVSDLVRMACRDLLVKHEALKRLENSPEDLWASEEVGLAVMTMPML